jgi:hypothetical protein
MIEYNIYNKTAPNTRQTVQGRIRGPWGIHNTGNRHTGWAVHDIATGYRLFHGAPTLKAANTVLDAIDAAGLELDNSHSWDEPQWGDHKSYTSDSIQAIGTIVRPYLTTWTRHS